MFEHRKKPPLSARHFALRQLKFLLVALLFIGVSLVIGTWGYVHYAGFTDVDAFLNASMILAGMGPMGELPSDGAKLFASFYALYSGIALLTTVAVILAPLVHRVLHLMHVEEDGEEDR
jgi:hypothetical protein